MFMILGESASTPHIRQFKQLVAVLISSVVVFESV